MRNFSLPDLAERQTKTQNRKHKIGEKQGDFWSDLRQTETRTGRRIPDISAVNRNLLLRKNEWSGKVKMLKDDNNRKSEECNIAVKEQEGIPVFQLSGPVSSNIQFRSNVFQNIFGKRFFSIPLNNSSCLPSFSFSGTDKSVYHFCQK